MSYYTLEGTLHKIFDTEQKSEKFRVREFVVITDEKYPQTIKFQLSQARVDLIDNYAVGEPITVDFGVVGREWNEKYFVNLNAFRISYGNSSHTENTVPAASSEADDAEYLASEIPF